ncbi:ankyrin repeat domain-containing protein [Paraglaciecola sp.]|uniref:ankyrin repeat domain-containing protein n=1 Tax=Paraglaciecola sp. TaxID=1920173 RepID=UPI0030F403EF
MKKLIITGFMTMAIFGTASGIAQSVADDLSPTQHEVLERAIHSNDYQAVVKMLDKGLDINGTIDGDGTLLIMAIKAGHDAMVYSLIDAGADVNLTAVADGNPLISAAMMNNLSVAQRLVDEGALVDALVEHDETALINASRMGHFEMVKFFVEKGADVNLGVHVNTVKGSIYRSPLNGAKTDEIRHYLLRMGAKA